MTRERDKPYDVVVVGGGAAGIGVGVAIKHAGIQDFAILERYKVGASFESWPAETRFITPSFPTNSIGMLDLNAVAIGCSPAHHLRVEHPTGREFAMHLRTIARFFELPIREGVEVLRVARSGDVFSLETAGETLHAKHLVWAAGEFQFPRLHCFPGSELCRHTATIASYEELEGDDFIIVGGYESGIDAAYHLARLGKRVRIFDEGCPWGVKSSDPSLALSTYSLERMSTGSFVERVQLFPNAPIASVSRSDGNYRVEALVGASFETSVPPLLAGGFEGSHKLVAHLFERRDDGYPLLNERDESTILSGMFLCGPAVRHDKHVFCFIYKFRQRFAVVAKAIATSLGLPAHALQEYRKWGMYLNDLSNCGEECIC